jgi:hypothetical protein
MLQSSAFPSCANDGTSIRLHDIFCLAQECSELPMTNSRVVCPPRINQFCLPRVANLQHPAEKIRGEDVADLAQSCGKITAITRQKEQGGRHDVCIRQFDHWVRCHNNHRCNVAGAHDIRRPFTVMLRNQHRLVNRGGQTRRPHSHASSRARGQPDSCIRNSLSAVGALKYQSVVRALTFATFPIEGPNYIAPHDRPNGAFSLRALALGPRRPQIYSRVRNHSLLARCAQLGYRCTQRLADKPVRPLLNQAPACAANENSNT